MLHKFVSSWEVSLWYFFVLCGIGVVVVQSENRAAHEGLVLSGVAVWTIWGSYRSNEQFNRIYASIKQGKSMHCRLPKRKIIAGHLLCNPSKELWLNVEVITRLLGQSSFYKHIIGMQPSRKKKGWRVRDQQQRVFHNSWFNFSSFFLVFLCLLH